METKENNNTILYGMAAFVAMIVVGMCLFGRLVFLLAPEADGSICDMVRAGNTRIGIASFLFWIFWTAATSVAVVFACERGVGDDS